MLVNKRLATSFWVHEHVSTRSYEILTRFDLTICLRNFVRSRLSSCTFLAPTIHRQLSISLKVTTGQWIGLLTRPYSCWVTLLCMLLRVFFQIFLRMWRVWHNLTRLLTSVLAIFLTHFNHYVGHLWVTLAIKWFIWFLKVDRSWNMKNPGHTLWTFWTMIAQRHSGDVLSALSGKCFSMAVLTTWIS